MPPSAIRVRTAAGWQDIAIVGPPGAKGDTGDTGATGATGTVYDSDQIGVVKGWSGKTIPTNWVLTDGARYTQVAFPQGYDFAKQEADAGNPLWTYRISDFTFTVPNLTDKFLLAPGASRTIGMVGGVESVALGSTELGDHFHYVTPGGTLNVTGGTPYGAAERVQVQSSGKVITSAATAHNNMPPYVIVAMIVKIKGAVLDPANAIVGPPGPIGPPGQGVPVGGTANQVLKKNTVTDYDTSWAAPTGGSGLPEVYVGADPPTPRDAQVIWIDTDESPVASLNVGMDVWHTVGAAGEPQFQNSWVNFDAANLSAIAFRKYPDGTVRLKGQVKNGTLGAVIFTLPVGYRPPIREDFVQSGANTGFAIVPSGDVIPIAANGNARVTLDGITFDTESVQQVASLAAQPLDSVHVVGATGEPAFQTGWSAYAANPPQTARFRKYPDGRVRVTGITIANAGFTFASNGNLFVLPAGYRPAANVNVYAMHIDGVDGSIDAVRLIVLTSGQVQMQATTGPSYSGGAGSLILLDGVEFDTEALTTYSTGAIIPSAQSMPVSMDTVHMVGAAGEPAFANGFLNYDASGLRNVRFRKYPDGRVRLAGIVKTGPSGSAIFTLPPGYRPAAATPFVTLMSPGTSTFAEVDVNANGTVIPYGTGVATWVALDGIEFDTETTLVTASVAVQPIEVWHAVGASGEPAFQSSWVNVGSTSSVAGYRKFPDGRVRLRGTVKGGADFSTIFTLPAGYRPPATMIFPMPTADGASVTWVQINAAGLIQMGDVGSAAQASYLDGVEFDTEAVSNYATAVVQGATPAINPVVSTLPVAPVDGQECYYLADAANGVVWHLKYRAASSSALKWEVVGGPPLIAADSSGTIVTTTSGTPLGLAPSLIVIAPLAGDYMIGHGSGQMDNTGAAYAQERTFLNSVQNPDTLTMWGNSGNGVGPGFIRSRVNAVPLSAQIEVRYNATGATARFNIRRLEVMPVRVG